MAKCKGKQQKLTNLILNKAMEEQFTRFICITYRRKQNGNVLLTNEWCTEQLKQTQFLPMAKCTDSQQNRPNFQTERWWNNLLILFA